MTKNSKEQPKPQEEKAPSMLQMIKSFGKDLGNWVKEGAPVTSPADYIERLTACKNCPHFIEKHMRCGKCGCLVEHKAKWRTTVCPDNPPRWKPQNAAPKTAAEKQMVERQAQENKERDEDMKIEDKIIQDKKQRGEEEGVTDIEVKAYKEERDKGYVDFEEISDPKDV